MGGIDLLPRVLECEPFGAVHLGERAHLARAGRPLDGERVALDPRGIEVALECPGADQLSALLPDLAQGDRLAVGRRGAQLLLELATGGLERVFVRLVLAFGDRPGAFVAARPEGPARVYEQDLVLAARAAKQEQAGASAGRRNAVIVDAG